MANSETQTTAQNRSLQNSRTSRLRAGKEVIQNVLNGAVCAGVAGLCTSFNTGAMVGSAFGTVLGRGAGHLVHAFRTKDVFRLLGQDPHSRQRLEHALEPDAKKARLRGSEIGAVLGGVIGYFTGPK